MGRHAVVAHSIIVAATTGMLRIKAGVVFFFTAIP